MRNEQEEKRYKKLNRWFKLLRLWEKTCFRVFYPYKKHGYLKKYNDKPMIFIGNHYSVFDVVFPAIATNKPVHFMAKNSLFEQPIMRQFVKTCQCIRVKRDGTDFNAVKEALKYLKNGEHIGIFPEGARNWSYDDFLPFMGGAVSLSIKTQTPIVPIIIVQKVQLFKRIDVVYGEPIEFRKYYGKKLNAEEIAKCEAELRDIMKNMRQSFVDKYKIKFGKMHFAKVKDLKRTKHRFEKESDNASNIG